MDLLVRVQKYMDERELLTPGVAVVVGVSGGPDSLCLLDLLHRLALDRRWRLHVAHLNHHLRSEAIAEAEFVHAEAEKRALPFHTETADVRAYAVQHKQSLEEAARNCRYAFLARVAASVDSAHIAVAHTADDQAETVLMHFLRGSGLAGMRGMLPKTPGRYPLSVVSVIRPLLHVSRAEVEAYCAEHHLTPVHDPSNADTTFFRNRLRHELLPELEKYNPNIRAVLGRMADVAAGEHELLERVIADLWRRMVRVEDSLFLEIDRPHWQNLSVPEQRALLRRAVQILPADKRNVDFAPLEQAVRFTHRATSGQSCDLVNGLRLRITPKTILIGFWHNESAPDHLPLLDAKGRLLPVWRFTIQPSHHDAKWLASIEANTDRWSAYVDKEAVISGLGLSLRPRRPGDRFAPLGLAGHFAKLSDFFINNKIDGSLRNRWPLVVCGDDIVWVAGLRLDERFKVTPETKSVLRLSFTKTE